MTDLLKTAPSPQAQQWALHAANRIGSSEFGIALHGERIQIIAEAIDEACKPASIDADIGKAWREDSSLERWFPFTADEVHMLRMRTAEMRISIGRQAKQIGEMEKLLEATAHNHEPGYKPSCIRCAWDKLKKEL